VLVVVMAMVAGMGYGALFPENPVIQGPATVAAPVAGQPSVNTNASAELVAAESIQQP
jgi:hypothetical protein